MAKIEDWLHWTPRVLAILFAIFISLFALDVFAEGFGLRALMGFLIHLIPTYLIIIALLIAWRWEKIGGVLFIALGLFYIIMVWPRFEFAVYMIIVGPLILIGLLFFISKLDFKTKKIKVKKAEEKKEIKKAGIVKKAKKVKAKKESKKAKSVKAKKKSKKPKKK